MPADRVALLAAHLLNPATFWRHHPVPTLAADSPRFSPAGDYWLGSTWAPTNAATIYGFDRADQHDLAVRVAVRHLDCLTEVLESTGSLWENYCSEKSERGNVSGPDYSWTSLGAIALLLEVIIGVRPDALHRRIDWALPTEAGFGIAGIPLGDTTVTLRLDPGRTLHVVCDRAFTLVIHDHGRERTHQVEPGTWTLPAFT